MSAYVVLARKWRPAQFSDIVGQSHIVKTLTNAIRSQRIHQAYLFTGSRGIGKTSIARIFAKVIRCENVKDQDGILKSCDQCSSCREITAGNSVDVIEIDGASNNGVEAVREIRENAKYMPSSGARKIYIIDEVHMLTTAAFNALLKTLEEPPAHVIFIFATTEPHKIPATILSRCQRFDYRRVTMPQIQNRISEVIHAEGVDAESGAVLLIARAAEGSMRDALSLLDQVIAFAGTKITVQSVRESVGLIEGQVILGIIKGIFERAPLQALTLTEQAFQQGHDLRVLTRSLIEFLHAALLTQVGATHSGSLELSPEEWNELKTIAALRSIEEIELIFQVLHQGLEWIARSPQPKIVLDVLLIKCATAEALVYLDSSSHPASISLPPNQTSLPSEGVRTQTAQKPIEKPTQSFDKSATSLANPSRPNHFSGSHLQNEYLDHSIPTLPAASTSASPLVPTATSASPLAPTATPASPAPPAAATTGSFTIENFIEHVRRSRPLLASILEHSCSTKMPQLDRADADKTFLICFPPHEAYFKEQLQSRAYQEQLNLLSKSFFGTPIRLIVELKDAGESLVTRKDREKKEKVDSAKEQAQNHPIIREAKSLFGGDLGPIDLREDRHANLST